eukprot:3864082-Rhodomonas_salina.1
MSSVCAPVCPRCAPVLVVPGLKRQPDGDMMARKWRCDDASAEQGLCDAGFQQYSKLDNRRLLWHGTNVAVGACAGHPTNTLILHNTLDSEVWSAALSTLTQLDDSDPA